MNPNSNRARRPWKLFIAFILLCCFSNSSRAQTTLAAGDLVFVGYNCAGATEDEFSFVLLTPVSAGTQIRFTDFGWCSDINGFQSYNPCGANTGANSDGAITWTSGSALPCGTQVRIQCLQNLTASVGTVTGLQATGANSSFYINLGNGGESIFAFQGTLASPTLISALNMNGGWDATLAQCTFNSAQSTLPAALASHNLVITPERDNAIYNCTVTANSPANLRTAIYNNSNWITQDVTPFTLPISCTFSCNACTAPSVTSHPSNRAICAGNNTTFGIAATGSGLTYQWQVNTGSGYSNLSNNAPYSNVTTNTMSITGATAGMNGYFYRCVVTGTCGSATSNGGMLTISSPGTWLGTSSTAWSNTANWSCGTIPVAATNVTIPAGAPNMPVVDISNAVCNNLTINSGATLSITNAANNLDINGVFINNGTFTNNAGKTTFSGDAQSVPAGTYNNLEISGSGNKTLAGPVTVSGTLTLTAGCLQTGNYELTIGSTGSIVSSPSNFIVLNGGILKQQNIGATGRTSDILFPVGLSASSYTPVSIMNSGTADVFGVQLLNGVNSAYNSSDQATGSPDLSNNVNRTWLLTEGVAGGSNVTLTFEWTASDEQSGFDRSNCFVGHYYDDYWHAGPAGAASGTNPYSKSLSNVTSFSPFGVGSSGSVLPLNLLSFTGKGGTTGNVLSWITSNEINVADFEVGRGTDGIHFSTIGKVNALANGATGKRSYQFTDAQPGNLSFYRLKINDKDGGYKYSSVVSIGKTTDNATPYTIFPNPVTGSLLYIRPQEIVTNSVIVSITDATGRNWYSGKMEAAVLNSGSAAINISSLPAGVYALHIRNEKTGAINLLKFKK